MNGGKLYNETATNAFRNYLKQETLDIKVIDVFLNKDADPNVVLENGRTALDVALGRRNYAVAAALLEKEAVYESDSLHINKIQYLNRVNADPNHVENGRAAIEVAAATDDIAMVGRLLERGAYVNAQGSGANNSFCFALYSAVSFEHNEVAQLLLNRGALPNLKHHRYQDTALHAAVRHNNFPAIRFLVERGADLTATNQHGESPLKYARVLGRVEVLAVLQELSPAGQDVGSATSSEASLSSSHDSSTEYASISSYCSSSSVRSSSSSSSDGSYEHPELASTSLGTVGAETEEAEVSAAPGGWLSYFGLGGGAAPARGGAAGTAR